VIGTALKPCPDETRRFWRRTMARGVGLPSVKSRSLTAEAVRDDSFPCGSGIFDCSNLCLDEKIQKSPPDGGRYRWRVFGAGESDGLRLVDAR
jgi:hypothetical protein